MKERVKEHRRKGKRVRAYERVKEAGKKKVELKREYKRVSNSKKVKEVEESKAAKLTPQGRTARIAKRKADRVVERI